MTDNTNKGFWERMARIYTAFMSKNDTAYEQICKLSEQYIDSEKSVLELACGTGQITFLMAGKSGSWEATDYSENMIKEAEKRNQGEHKCEQLRFCVQDATNLTYEDEKFNVVVIANALHIMPQPEKALKEIHRVLKKDGILFAPTFVYERGYPKLPIWLMEKAGFKTYHKWQREELKEYVGNKGFCVVGVTLVKGKPLSECVLVAKKSGAVEPVGAVLTLLLVNLIVPALPYLLSFAAGAMLYVVVEELIPEMSQGHHSNIGTIFFAVGFSIMMTLDVALG